MKRVATIQDISCIGKCSLTTALPILSAAGIETAVIPTALLSNHTAFSEFTFRDLTDEIIDSEGNFVTCEETETEISLSEGVVSGLVGDVAIFSLEDVKKRNLKVELEYDSNIFTFDENSALNDGKIKISLKL